VALSYVTLRPRGGAAAPEPAVAGVTAVTGEVAADSR
jgi:hypothetical protein